MSAGATFLAFLTVCYMTSHARLAQVTEWHDFSNKARLLLDLSHVFQNVSPCEIMWKIKESLFIYLSGYRSCHVRQA